MIVDFLFFVCEQMCLLEYRNTGSSKLKVLTIIMEDSGKSDHWSPTLQ